MDLELQAWKKRLKGCLKTASLNAEQVRVILAKYELATAMSGDYENAFVEFVDTFASEDSTKALHEAKAEISQLERAYNQDMQNKYGVPGGKLEVEHRHPNAPTSLPSAEPTKPSIHEVNRLDTMKAKYKMDGLQLVGHEDRQAQLSEGKKMLVAHGKFKGKAATLSYERTI